MSPLAFVEMLAALVGVAGALRVIGFVLDAFAEF